MVLLSVILLQQCAFHDQQYLLHTLQLEMPHSLSGCLPELSRQVDYIELSHPCACREFSLWFDLTTLESCFEFVILDLGVEIL